MTEAHQANEYDGPHEGPIKTPKQLVLAVLFAFLVPIFGIVLLVMYVGADKRPAAGSDAFTAKAVAERIRPVGIVDVKDVSDVGAMKSGEQVFAGQCSACHASGALGAPKLGDAEAWAARIKTGFDALLHSAIAGKGQMPPQAGGDFTDFEIARAVVYLADKAGAKFPEPQMPAAGASGAAATTTAAAAVNPSTTAPRGDANAGSPATGGTLGAGLNAQVANAPTNAVPAPPSTVVAAAAPSTAAPTTATPAAAAATTAAAATAGTAPATTVAAAGAAPALVGQVCSVCHGAGIAGAPKTGDKAAWAPRIAQGIDALTASAIKGKGAMPPKGGSAASDAEIKAAVTYFVNAAK